MPVKPKPDPEAKEHKKALPEQTELKQEQPEAKPLDKAMPPAVNPENVVKLGDLEIEIKPTKIKYQRNRTTMAYRILDLYPLTDVLAMNKGIVDPERDGDEIVFDFLCAVFDNSKLVTDHYDDMTSEDIDRIVKIFKRLNRIDEKEEAAKNREAKETEKA